MAVKYVLLYATSSDPEALALAAMHFPAHRARLNAFHERGLLLMVGPFSQFEEGAMGIFTSREAVEEFVREDPFVLNGVVKSWSVREWREIFV